MLEFRLLFPQAFKICSQYFSPANIPYSANYVEDDPMDLFWNVLLLEKETKRSETGADGVEFVWPFVLLLGVMPCLCLSVTQR